ncbi:hypothetical protein LPJ70_007005 [Coemansia sp. RSA 2708]|nr:hypothetical protein LPJ70_007005 [Coemansia sp. RSA 2708]
MAAMSVSLPNSPFFGLPLDNAGHPLLSPHNAAPHDAAQLFPPLSDAAFAAAAAAASTPAAPLQSLTTAALYPGAVAGSPAFWDVSGSLGAPLGSATTASLQSPYAPSDAHFHESGDAVAAAVAAMELANCASADKGAASVAIYPQPAASMAAPAWDELGAAASLSTVLGSPDMLMSMVQPSPAPSHYNVSAQATPAFDSFHTQLQTPGPAALADDAQSAMAAYFGAPGPMSSQETVAAQSQPVIDQLKLFAAPPSGAAHQIDAADLPTTSCAGF